MSAVLAASAVIGGATIYSATQMGKAADRSAAAAEAGQQLQFEISQQQIDLATEQWSLYKSKILPYELEQMELGADRAQLDQDIYKQYYAPLQEAFATEAMEGIEADPERAAREARVAVDQAFDTEEGMRQRELERRGVRPGSGAYESGTADTSLARASSKALTVNRAREYERDRAEDINFARKATALGRSPGMTTGSPGITPGASAAGLAAAGNTAYGAGSQAAQMAGMYGNATAGAITGGIQLGTQAYDLFNRYKTPAAPAGGVNIGFNPTSFGSYPSPAAQPAGGGVDLGFAPTSFNSYAEGGPVMAPELARGGYAQGGMVEGPPGYDQVPATVRSPDGAPQPAALTAGEYVIPADVVQAVGTDPLDEIVEKARERKMKRLEPPNQLSRGRQQ